MTGNMSTGRPESSGRSDMGRGLEGGGYVIEVKGKDDFANMMQYGIRQNANRDRNVPSSGPDNAPSIAR